MNPSYQPGTTIELRGERWVLSRAQPFAACTVLTLEGLDRVNAATRMRVIDPFDRPRIISPPTLTRRPRRAVLRAALGALTSVKSAGGLWVAAGARMELWPYQLEPALAAIGGATRLLLADAVGLGKTIQAGLLLAELRERGWVERALIVCPAGLRDTWAAELRERFSIESTIADHAGIAERIATRPPGVTPWDSHAVTIASVDFIKRPEVLAALQEVPIDLVIADEAHHLAPATDRGAAVSALASRVPWVVLLSATPHSGDTRAFAYLTNLGAHGDRLIVFRRSRRDVGLASRRRTRYLAVSPRGSERVLFEAVNRYVQDIWRSRGATDLAARLVAIIIARRSASTTAALERTLQRRLELLGQEPGDPVQAALPWDDVDGGDDVASDATLAAPGFADVREERCVIERLLALARQCGAGSKLAWLARAIRRLHEPAIVFTEYRDSLEAVVDALSSRHRVCAIHGGMAADLRRQATQAFTTGEAEVLIATDTAGEGLNLHHRCRVVIDLELPWNPVRLEQRIGRVDRIGQQRTVHAIRAFHRDTIESRVLEHLQLRQHRADVALGRCASETDVASAVIGGIDAPVSTPPAVVTDAVEGADVEAARAATRRRAMAPGADAVRCWSTTRHARSVTLLHRARFINQHGLAMHERLVAHEVLIGAAPRSRYEWHSAIARISAALERLAVAHGGEQPAHPMLRARIAAIHRHLAAQLAVEHQRSLFDRRADAHAARQAAVIQRLDAALVRVLNAVTAPPDGSATRVELIAAWSGPRS